MGYSFMVNVLEQLKKIAKNYKINKVVLFGSRARGDHGDTSDYDIAVFGQDLSEVDRARFYDDVEEIETLKKFDIVFIDEKVDEALVKNIMREGVTIYEQARSKGN